MARYLLEGRYDMTLIFRGDIDEKIDIHGAAIMPG
jgi:hypothetical protein